MKRPSKRSVLIGSGFFALGFIAAIALTAGFVTWLIGQSRDAVQSRIIGDLSTNTLLLRAADRQSSSVLENVIANARLNSLTVAAAFDALDKNSQQAVLDLFTMLNHSATLRARTNGYGNTVLLARVMVMCTHHSANPGYVMYDGDEGVRIDPPAWVFDPAAAPTTSEPDIPVQWYSQPRPVVAAAVRKHWTKLHGWVKANQACIATQETLP